MRASRPWLAAVLILFCLPLFIGLERIDLETDEAIYSFAVDRILETGDWLEPRSSPSETNVFLEKPPLKFWIVAASIKLGLLPHNEFGLRFWDALAGSAAFVYVFLIGSLLAGPICGGVAVLLLFVHGPLVFQHGLRTNNMEAALLLAYSGGMYHLLRWGRIEDARSRRVHAAATGLFFVVAFMTKFVAAFFLPLVAGICIVSAPAYRAQLVRDRRLWGAVALLVAALILPWFIYAHVRFGRLLWDVMLGAHVLVRFTGTLMADHRQPWSFYFISMSQSFGAAGWLVVAGLVTLVVQSIRRRSAEGAMILVWAVLPILLISFGTSKLYHYAYPFLPPLTLAAGYVTSLFVMLAPVPLTNALQWVEDRLALVPLLRTIPAQPRIVRLIQVIIALSAVLAVAGAVTERVRFELPGGSVFRSSGIVRPIVVMMAAGILVRMSAQVSRVFAVVIALSVLPIGAYYATLKQLPEYKQPLHRAGVCVQELQARGGLTPGLHVNLPSDDMWHPLYYYLRRIQPWTRYRGEPTDVLNRYLYDPDEWRPVLIGEENYRQFIHRGGSGVRPAGATPAMITAFDVIVLLPGPYAACSPEAPLHVTRSPR
ncbi:MAG: hypothetical protein GEU82_04855 [Luteitalea sp.]|nr:hypothetical protein [Luteitalea sp.]